jgi:hypothetical protein
VWLHLTITGEALQEVVKVHGVMAATVCNCVELHDGSNYVELLDRVMEACALGLHEVFHGNSGDKCCVDNCAVSTRSKGLSDNCGVSWRQLECVDIQYAGSSA